MNAVVCNGFGGNDVMSQIQLSKPEVGPLDVLVRNHAAAANPIDYKVRNGMGLPNENRVLGYDGAGVIESVGAEVKGFKSGDAVYYAGDVTKNGSFAEFTAVDYRIVAHKPTSASFAQAAALPLVGLTVLEGLHEGLNLPTETPDKSILIINGAGGVGSIAIQLAKNSMKAKQVIATASRPETIEFCKKMGADAVINHRNSLAAELEKIKVTGVDVVFCAVDLELHYDAIVDILNPGGKMVSITVGDSSKIDVGKLFFPKRLTLAFELMLSRPMLNDSPERQGEWLKVLAGLYDSGAVKPIDTRTLGPFGLDSVNEALTIQASGSAFGKTVVSFN